MSPLQRDHDITVAAAGVDLRAVDELLADALGDPHNTVDARRVESRQPGPPPERWCLVTGPNPIPEYAWGREARLVGGGERS